MQNRARSNQKVAPDLVQIPSGFPCVLVAFCLLSVWSRVPAVVFLTAVLLTFSSLVGELSQLVHNKVSFRLGGSLQLEVLFRIQLCNPRYLVLVANSCVHDSLQCCPLWLEQTLSRSAGTHSDCQ